MAEVRAIRNTILSRLPSRERAQILKKAKSIELPTDTVLVESHEPVGSRLVEAGFSVRKAVVLLSTVYTFTISFVIEEQAVFPVKGERSSAYDIQKRNSKLNAKKFPLLRQSGVILFDGFDQRFEESLDLIIRGASFSKR